MITSLLNIITSISALLCLLRIPSSKTIFTWLPVCLFLQVGCSCLTVGLLSLSSIGFTPWTIIATNIGIVAVSFFYEFRSNGFISSNIKKRGDKDAFIKQVEPDKRRWFKTKIIDLDDILAYLLVIILTTVLFSLIFTPSMILSFKSPDSAVHFRNALGVYEGSKIGGQYLTHLMIADAFSLVAPVIDMIYFYKVFIIMQVLFFALSGLMMYTLLKAVCSQLNIAVICILLFFYQCGYPLSNLIYGFSYLGIGVISTCLVFIMCDLISKGIVKGKWSYFALSLSLFELFISYTIFIPPIYLGVFFFLIFHLRKRDHGILRIARDEFLVVGIPCILGFVLMFMYHFGASLQKAATAATLNGGIFGDLYAGFIFLSPLAIYGAAMRFKEGAIRGFDLPALGFVGYAVAVFIGGIYGVVSAYYFFKLYYVLWLIFFLYAALGVQKLAESSPALLASYAATWLLVMAIAFSGFDEKVSQNHPQFDPNPVAESLFPIYFDNLKFIRTGSLTEESMDAFDAARSLFANGETVGIISDDYGYEWFRTLFPENGQQKYWGISDDIFLDELRECDYVLYLPYESMSALPTASGTTPEDLGNYISDDAECVFEEGDTKIFKSSYLMHA